MKKLHITLPVFLFTIALILSGCTGQTKTPSDKDTVSEFSSDSNSENSTEQGEISADDSSPESTAEVSVNRCDDYGSYQEIYLDQKYLETIKEDRLYVRVVLQVDEETVRADYEKKYPELMGKEIYWYYWGRFFSNRGEQLIRELVSDYNIEYEELASVFEMGFTFWNEFDKDIVSTLLNDTRVAEIVYCVGEPPVIENF